MLHFLKRKLFRMQKALNKIIYRIKDPQFLGTAIFSKWRFITHWSETSLLAPQYRIWFITALSWLEVLSADNGN